MIGPSTTNPELKSEAFFGQDGKLRGTLMPYIGRGTNLSYEGTWFVSDKGSLCADIRTQSNARIERCDWYFRLGDAYYTSQGDTSSAPVVERQISR